MVGKVFGGRSGLERPTIHSPGCQFRTRECFKHQIKMRFLDTGVMQHDVSQWYLRFHANGLQAISTGGGT
jgi:hypothetical protein